MQTWLGGLAVILPHLIDSTQLNFVAPHGSRLSGELAEEVKESILLRTS